MTTFSVRTRSEDLSVPLRYLRAVWEFLFHTVAVICVLGCFWSVEKVMDRFGSADKIFRMGSFSIQWNQIFDFIDLALIVCLLLVGTALFLRKVFETRRCYLVMIEEHPRAKSEGE